MSTAINAPNLPASFIVEVLFAGLEVARPCDVIVEIVAESQRERSQRSGRIVAGVEGVDGCPDDKEVLCVPMLQMGRHNAGAGVVSHDGTACHMRGLVDATVVGSLAGCRRRRDVGACRFG